MPNYTRRLSNDLAASIRLDQLRQLQAQLGKLIQEANDLPRDEESGLDRSTHSSVSSSSKNVSSLERLARDASESSAPLKGDSHDVESGTSTLPASYKLRRRSQLAPVTYDDDTTQHNARGRTLSRVASTDTLPVTHRLKQTDDLSITHRNGVTSDATIISTSGSDSQRKPKRTYSPFWRSRSRSSEHSSSFRRNSLASRNRSSIFGTGKKDASSLLDSSCKSHPQLPTYDFLQKDDEEKGGGSLLPGAKWWHGVFLVSLISLTACMITLWAPYPIGARMPTEIIATMPWSNGCQGLQSCICPRETICADDLLSMIFLTIARSTAWADYPLYMLMFMSKANNLNNFLQGTALRCWINFSDYHRVHSLFGIIVGFESTSHTFFHILRWARRNDDIQVRLL